MWGKSTRGNGRHEQGFALPDALVGLMLLSLGLTLSIQAAGVAYRTAGRSAEIRAEAAELSLRDAGEWGRALREGGQVVGAGGRWRVSVARIDNAEQPAGWSICRVETTAQARFASAPVRLVRLRFCPPPS